MRILHLIQELSGDWTKLILRGCSLGFMLIKIKKSYVSHFSSYGQHFDSTQIVTRDDSTPKKSNPHAYQFA